MCKDDRSETPTNGRVELNTGYPAADVGIAGEQSATLKDETFHRRSRPRCAKRKREMKLSFIQSCGVPISWSSHWSH